MRSYRTLTLGVLIVSAAALVALDLSSSAVAAEPDPAAPLYASGTILEIDLDLPPAAFEALEDEPDEYVSGDVTVRFTDGTPGGVTKVLPIVHEVGIRLKGNVEGSFRPIDDKAAFKLKFAEFVKGQKLLGLKKLTLNNMVQDPSMLHETLAYEAFRAAGAPAPRTGYAFVRVNGADYGVYMDVETFDDVALKRLFGNFDDEVQHLYEGEYGTDVTPGGAGAFEVDEGDDEDLSDLEALIAAVNAPSPDFHTRVEDVADLAEMRRMWGVEKYVGMWDGYAGTNFPKLPNNFFLYSDPAGLFQMFPWGTDQAWEGPLDFDGDAGLMFDECVADGPCLSAYVDDLRAVGGTIAGLELESLADCLTDRLAPWRAMEAPPFREYEPAEIEQGLEDTYEVLEGRSGELIEWLESQFSETEEITPSGTPASCAIPPLDPEDEGEAGTDRGSKSAPGQDARVGAPVSPEPGGLSVRLRRVGSATIRATIDVPVAGRAIVTGKVGTYEGRLSACRNERTVGEAGQAIVRCRLSAEIRERLRARWLKLHLTIRFEARDGTIQTATRSIVMPRIDRSR